MVHLPDTEGYFESVQGNPEMKVVYKSVVSGKDLPYKSIHATWDDIARQYEELLTDLITK